jgi:hypothetical protein
MRPHPRIYKAIKWRGAAVTVLLVAWAVSGSQADDRSRRSV